MTNREKLLDLIKNSDDVGIEKISETLFGDETPKKITIAEGKFAKIACGTVKDMILEEPSCFMIADILTEVGARIAIKLFDKEN